MPEMTRLVEQHPCFTRDCRGLYGRIHLPVAPRCNIQCAFCDRRYDCANESRPGVTSTILTPEEAVRRTAKALQQDSRIRVAGIAGPGDPLANPETFETLKRLRSEFPQLILCISTNGLLLEKSLHLLLEAQLDTITITVNAVRPETAGKIYTDIWWDGRRLSDGEGAARLLRQQHTALRLCAESGLCVKVNTVLIPGVNEGEVGEIAQIAAEAGAVLMNIVPLIPCGKMQSIQSPTAWQIQQARQKAGEWIPQFTHCQQCRADACGVL